MIIVTFNNTTKPAYVITFVKLSYVLEGHICLVLS
jgi:hypothetical protein